MQLYMEPRHAMRFKEHADPNSREKRCCGSLVLVIEACRCGSLDGEAQELRLRMELGPGCKKRGCDSHSG